jgi:hypothetical protein
MDEENNPKKGWVFIAINPHIGFILLALIEEKISSRRCNRKAKNDLNVLRTMLMTTLNCEHTFYDSEGP